MLISASLFSNKDRPIAELLSDIQESSADMIHFDFSLGTDPDYEVLSQLRSQTRLPFDGHLINETPLDYLERFEQAGFDQVAFQAENVNEALLNNCVSEQYNMRVGLAIQVKPGVDRYYQYLKNFDYVLVMTTIPGVSGMKFNEDTYSIIDDIRKIEPQIMIEVDGGVGADQAKQLLKMNVDIAVSGSSLINSKPMKAQMARLVSSEARSFFKKILIPSRRTPIVSIDTQIQKLIEVIGFYKLGGAIVSDGSQRLAGLVTNGDLRDAMAKYQEKIFSMTVGDIFNPQPKSIKAGMSRDEILDLIASEHHCFTIIPIIDDRKNIVGCTSTAKVIRGK